MNGLKSMNIINTDGNNVEIKVITALKKPDESKKFLLYTFDDSTENIDIYASILNEENDSYQLLSITDEEDWDLIQKAIKELSE